MKTPVIFTIAVAFVLVSGCSAQEPTLADEEPDVPVLDFIADGYESTITWGEQWRPDSSPSKCQNSSAFPDVNLSSHGQFNLELITGKKFEQITKTDLTSILQLEFSDWSGIPHLPSMAPTRLEEFGQGFQVPSRTHRFKVPRPRRRRVLFRRGTAVCFAKT